MSPILAVLFFFFLKSKFINQEDKEKGASTDHKQPKRKITRKTTQNYIKILAILFNRFIYLKVAVFINIELLRVTPNAAQMVLDTVYYVLQN